MRANAQNKSFCEVWQMIWIVYTSRGENFGAEPKTYKGFQLAWRKGLCGFIATLCDGTKAPIKKEQGCLMLHASIDLAGRESAHIQGVFGTKKLGIKATTAIYEALDGPQKSEINHEVDRVLGRMVKEAKEPDKASEAKTRPNWILVFLMLIVFAMALLCSTPWSVKTNAAETVIRIGSTAVEIGSTAVESVKPVAAKALAAASELGAITCLAIPKSFVETLPKIAKAAKAGFDTLRGKRPTETPPSGTNPAFVGLAVAFGTVVIFCLNSYGKAIIHRRNGL